MGPVGGLSMLVLHVTRHAALEGAFNYGNENHVSDHHDNHPGEKR